MLSCGGAPRGPLPAQGEVWCRPRSRTCLLQGGTCLFPLSLSPAEQPGLCLPQGLKAPWLLLGAVAFTPRTRPFQCGLECTFWASLSCGHASPRNHASHSFGFKILAYVVSSDPPSTLPCGCEGPIQGTGKRKHVLCDSGPLFAHL